MSRSVLFKIVQQKSAISGPRTAALFHAFFVAQLCLNKKWGRTYCAPFPTRQKGSTRLAIQHHYKLTAFTPVTTTERSATVSTPFFAKLLLGSAFGLMALTGWLTWRATRDSPEIVTAELVED